jgi:hypothetical protein
MLLTYGSDDGNTVEESTTEVPLALDPLLIAVLSVIPLCLHLQMFNKLHCKKRLAIFPSPAGMSLNKLSLAGVN